MENERHNKLLADAGVGAFSESMGGLYVGTTKLKEMLFLRRELPQALLTWDGNPPNFR